MDRKEMIDKWYHLKDRGGVWGGKREMEVELNKKTEKNRQRERERENGRERITLDTHPLCWDS